MRFATVLRGGAAADRAARDAVRQAALPITGASRDYDPLLERIGDARFVLIGEASHGTHEFYNERARITRRLIEEKGFNAVAVEADWPDAYAVNRFVRAEGGDGDTAIDSLAGFERFPQWMWRNTVVLDFITDLRQHNDAVPPGQPAVGFYGIDLYSLGGSIQAVLGYLDTIDPEAARRARERYACFEMFGNDPQQYGMAAGFGIEEPCEDEAIHQLVELQKRAAELAGRDGQSAEDEFFFAEQNARLVVNAEEYYRAMFRGGRDNTWNLRDTHMADTLDALDAHLTRRDGRPARIVVWAHNSHLGDARATEMGGARGELNVGQLVRERHGGEAFNIGFSTYTGTVTAADDWGGAAQLKRVVPALPESVEALLHAASEAGADDFLLDLRAGGAAADVLRRERLERAIGVIYRPQTERWSHYFNARLSDQFDAVIHIDQTRAVEPLERTPSWDTNAEPPETFPSGV